MSTPEEIESESAGSGSSVTRAVEGPLDMARAIDQLRALVCGLGAGLLVVSLALTAFVYKQNRNLVGTTTLRQRQIAQFQANERSVNSVITALIQYSSGKPELIKVLARHGLQVAPPPAASPAQP
jgi:hypothetical protein